jgi:hypothetical protein
LANLIGAGRNDLCGCFSQDLTPRLPLPAPWLQVTLPALSDDPVSTQLSKPIALAWKQEFPCSLNLITTFDFFAKLADDPTTQWNAWIEPLLHRLLSLRPLLVETPPTRIVILEEVSRIGTLLALAPIWRTFGIHPVRTGALRFNLLSILSRYFVEWGSLQPFLLWILMHATREADTDSERIEFGTRLAMVMTSQGIVGWEQLAATMESVYDCRDDLAHNQIWNGVRTFLDGVTPPWHARKTTVPVDNNELEGLAPRLRPMESSRSLDPRMTDYFTFGLIDDEDVAGSRASPARTADSE